MKPYNFELKMIKEYILNLIKTKNMKNLNKDEALTKLADLEAAFKKETAELKRIIENSDKKLPAIDRLNSVEDAIAELGEDDCEVKEYRKMQKADLSIKLLAGQRIAIWVKAVNEGYVPDWNNSSEYKYLIWFDMRKEVGNGFFSSGYLYWHYGSSCSPSCLFYKSKELALASGAKPKIEQEYYNYMKK